MYESPKTNGLEDWSHDGRFLLFYCDSPKTRGDSLALPLSGDHKPIPLVQSPANESQFSISPNGRWIAYNSNESGRAEIYVQALGAALGLADANKGRGKWQVSNGGGFDPQWRADSKELFYFAASWSATSG